MSLEKAPALLPRMKKMKTKMKKKKKEEKKKKPRSQHKSNQTGHSPHKTTHGQNTYKTPDTNPVQCLQGLGFLKLRFPPETHWQESTTSMQLGQPCQTSAKCSGVWSSQT